MNETQELMANRVARFDRTFLKIERREHWLTKYLALRDSGMGHDEAAKKIIDEIESWKPKVATSRPGIYGIGPVSPGPPRGGAALQIWQRRQWGD